MKKVNFYFAIEGKSDKSIDYDVKYNGQIDEIKIKLGMMNDCEEINVLISIREHECYNEFVVESIMTLQKRLLPEYYSEIDFSSSSCNSPNWTRRMMSLIVINNLVKD